MGIKESRYPGDWLAKAKQDLRRVKILIDADDTEGAAFNLQQAIEKSLKAFLLSKGWRLERTHDLIRLLNSAIHYTRKHKHKPRLEKYRELCEQVTEYYLGDRYPIFYATSPTREEIKQGLAQAIELVDKVEAELGVE